MVNKIHRTFGKKLTLSLLEHIRFKWRGQGMKTYLINKLMGEVHARENITSCKQKLKHPKAKLHKKNTRNGQCNQYTFVIEGMGW